MEKTGGLTTGSVLSIEKQMAARVEVEITKQVIKVAEVRDGGDVGASVEFKGIVRKEEKGSIIMGLDYEAYESMAKKVMREILEKLALVHPFKSALVIHRIGSIPVGEAAIYVRVTSKHRREAISALSEFMDRLKEDVPIWKVGVF